MLSILSDFTFQQIICGTSLLGVLSGIVGVFAFLRKQSLLGDAISHAAFPGILLAFMIGASKSPLYLLLGGAVTGLLGALCVVMIVNYTPLKHDTALGIILSVFFGFGLILMTYIQRLQMPNQSVLNKFLFGNAATLLPEDIHLLLVVAIVILSSIYFFRRQLFFIAFDSSYAGVAGYRVQYWDLFLGLLLVVTIVVGLQTVGVVLMCSLLIAPAAAARQWSHKSNTMLLLSAFFGGASCVIGSLLSCVHYSLPTGPVIVVVMTIWALFSVVCAEKIRFAIGRVHNGHSAR